MTPECVEALQKVFRGCFQAPPLILEIGAADGTDSIDLFTLARVAGKPELHIFEPDPRNVVELKKKLALPISAAELRLDVFLPGITFNPVAVAAHDGTSPMYFSDGKHPNREGAWSFSNTLKPPTGHYKRYPWVTFNNPVDTIVSTIKLDTYYQSWLKHRVVDLIWADVNGAEREMIVGGHKMLQRTRYLLTEFARGPQLFEGQASLWELSRMLPDWEPEVVFESDILLKNTNYQPGGQYFGIQSFNDYSAAWDGDAQ